MKKLILTCVK